MDASAPPVAAPPRRRRWWPWLVALPFVLLLAGELLGWRFLRGPIESRLAQATGVELRLGAPFRLHLLGSPRLRLGGLHVGAAPRSAAPFLVQGEGLAVRAAWGELLQARRDGILRLRSVQADRLEAHLLRPRDGVPSWALGGDTPSPENNGSPPPIPRAAAVLLRDARLHVDDAVLGLQLEARITLEETADRGAPASAPSGVGPTTGFRATAEGRFRGEPLTLRVEAPAMLPLMAEPGSAPLDVTARIGFGEARAQFEGRLADLLGVLDLDGQVLVSGPSLAAIGEPLGLTLPASPPFELQARLRKQDAVWQAEVAKATIGRSRLRGSFRFEPAAAADARSRLSGRLEGERLVLGDLAPSVGAQSEVPRPGGKAAGGTEPSELTAPRVDERGRRVLPARKFDLPSLRAMDADVVIALDAMEFGTSALESLQPLRGRVRLDDGVLRISDLDARTAGGSVRGETSLDSTRSPPRWQADLQWRGVDLAGWARGLRTDEARVDARSSAQALRRERRLARAADAPVRAYATGELRGHIAMSGSGRSVAEILASADGRLQARLLDGSLSHLVLEAVGLDVAQALGVYLSGDDNLPVRCAVLSVQAKDGVMQPNLATLDTRDSRLLIGGTVDLRNELLDLTAVVQPKDPTPLSLRTPLRVQGSFAQPEPSVDAGPLVGRAVAAAVLAALNPVAGLLPFVDLGDDDRSRDCLPAAAPAR